MWSSLLAVGLFSTALFMIVLVLIQRGKGGGLAGAFGGMGGQSAFGTKAGDLFTRVTIGVAAFWILLCMFAVWHFGREQSILDSDLGTKAPAGADAAAVPETEEDVPPETPEPPSED